MPKRVFVSYCHKQSDWVWDRLGPCLKADGAEVLLGRESCLPGEWEHLSALRLQETQQPPQDENVARSLRRRLLIAEGGDADPWRLRVPLMRRWLIKRG